MGQPNDGYPEKFWYQQSRGQAAVWWVSNWLFSWCFCLICGYLVSLFQNEEYLFVLRSNLSHQNWITVFVPYWIVPFGILNKIFNFCIKIQPWSMGYVLHWPFWWRTHFCITYSGYSGEETLGQSLSQHESVRSSSSSTSPAIKRFI